MKITNNTIDEKTTRVPKRQTKSFTKSINVNKSYEANTASQTIVSGEKFDEASEDSFYSLNNNIPYYVTIKGTKTEGTDTTDIEFFSIVDHGVTTNIFEIEEDYSIHINISVPFFSLYFWERSGEERSINFDLTVTVGNVQTYVGQTVNICFDGSVYIKEMM